MCWTCYYSRQDRYCTYRRGNIAIQWQYRCRYRYLSLTRRCLAGPLHSFTLPDLNSSESCYTVTERNRAVQTTNDPDPRPSLHSSLPITHPGLPQTYEYSTGPPLGLVTNLPCSASNHALPESSPPSHSFPSSDSRASGPYRSNQRLLCVSTREVGTRTVALHLLPALLAHFTVQPSLHPRARACSPVINEG